MGDPVRPPCDSPIETSVDDASGVGVLERLLQLHLVPQRDSVLADLGKRGLDRPTRVVDRADANCREVPASLLVQGERGEVVIRRHEPCTSGTLVPKRLLRGLQEQASGATPPRAGFHRHRPDLCAGACRTGSVAAGPFATREPCDEPDRATVELRDGPIPGAALEDVDEIAPPRLQAPAEGLDEERLGPVEIRDLEGPDRQRGRNCQKPTP